MKSVHSRSASSYVPCFDPSSQFVHHGDGFVDDRSCYILYHQQLQLMKTGMFPQMHDNGLPRLIALAYRITVGDKDDPFSLDVCDVMSLCHV